MAQLTLLFYFDWGSAIHSASNRKLAICITKKKKRFSCEKPTFFCLSFSINCNRNSLLIDYSDVKLCGIVLFISVNLKHFFALRRAHWNTNSNHETIATKLNNKRNYFAHATRELPFREVLPFQLTKESKTWEPKRITAARRLAVISFRCLFNIILPLLWINSRAENVTRSNNCFGRMSKTELFAVF